MKYEFSKLKKLHLLPAVHELLNLDWLVRKEGRVIQGLVTAAAKASSRVQSLGFRGCRVEGL